MRSMTPFGKWLEWHGISYASAARALGISRAYVQMLATGSATPRLKTVGAAIQAWTQQLNPDWVITVASWFELKYPNPIAISGGV